MLNNLPHDSLHPSHGTRNRGSEVLRTATANGIDVGDIGRLELVGFLDHPLRQCNQQEQRLELRNGSRAGDHRFEIRRLHSLRLGCLVNECNGDISTVDRRHSATWVNRLCEAIYCRRSRTYGDDLRLWKEIVPALGSETGWSASPSFPLPR